MAFDMTIDIPQKIKMFYLYFDPLEALIINNFQKMSHAGNRRAFRTLLCALFVCIHCDSQIQLYLTNEIEFNNINLPNAIILCCEQ